MAFWSKERIESRHAQQPLVTPFASEHIEQNAYALGVAAKYAITSTTDGGVKRSAARGEHITIPPGQFALLLTEERVAVPENAMAFISMKAKFKLRGLVNVSGFHVDPGFSGRLKFAVYNAGSAAIDLCPRQRLFLIWYADLDQGTQAIYHGAHQGQDEITPDDVMSIRGIVVSPAAISTRVSALEESLRSDLRRLEDKLENHQSWSRPIMTGIALLLLGLLWGTLMKSWLESLWSQRTEAPTVTAPAPPASPASTGGSPTP